MTCELGQGRLGPVQIVQERFVLACVIPEQHFPHGLLPRLSTWCLRWVCAEKAASALALACANCRPSQPLAKATEWHPFSPLQGRRPHVTLLGLQSGHAREAIENPECPLGTGSVKQPCALCHLPEAINITVAQLHVASMLRKIGALARVYPADPDASEEGVLVQGAYGGPGIPELHVHLVPGFHQGAATACCQEVVLDKLSLLHVIAGKVVESRLDVLPSRDLSQVLPDHDRRVHVDPAVANHQPRLDTIGAVLLRLDGLESGREVSRLQPLPNAFLVQHPNLPLRVRLPPRLDAKLVEGRHSIGALVPVCPEDTWRLW
mmetsp:Transcript_116271/g.340145  ORF Transcript_116271/g.340145 Transcript_116271/m.340145 type:complete len:320 (+) Transcript_116271:550-1509(+)